MAQRYALKRGETLARIAKQFYDDAGLAGRLAAYNGIRDPNLVFVGQMLDVPSRRELLGEVASPVAPGRLATPNGLGEVNRVFGDVASFIGNDGTLSADWQRAELGRAELPWPLPLSWDHAQQVTRVLCHRDLVSVLSGAFQELDRAGLRGKVKSYGGCFAFRSKRTGTKLSTHSWGIAIDLNPETNGLGTPGDMDPDVVEVFRQYGFKWGGDWPGRGKDPMHFQYCTGY